MRGERKKDSIDSLRQLKKAGQMFGEKTKPKEKLRAEKFKIASNFLFIQPLPFYFLGSSKKAKYIKNISFIFKPSKKGINY